MFENPEIALDELPRADEVTWQSLDPRYVRRLQVQSVITTVIAATALLLFQLMPFLVEQRWLFRPAWLAIACSGVFGVLWPLISVPRKGYAVRDKDIVYRSGVLLRTVTAVPFNRIQHVETSSTPLDRHFGIAALQLFTAGGSGGDLKISGLPVTGAESIRVFILEKAGAGVEHN